VDDERLAAGIGDRADEVAHEAVFFIVIDADAVLDGDVDRDSVAHRLDAVGHQLRLVHQAGAKRTLLHALGGAAAVQVDLVVAPLLAELGALGQITRVAAAQLQGDGMLDVVEAQMTLGVAIDQRAGVDHLGVEPGVAGDLPVEDAAVAVGPVHHRSNRQTARWRDDGSGSRNGRRSAHAGGCGRLGEGDEYCRKRAIISQSCSGCMHVADRLGQALRCTGARLEKDAVGNGLRFQVAC
jgi:hypothetical protein